MSGKTLHGNDNRCDRMASYAASFMAAARQQRRGDSTLEGATASARRASNSGGVEEAGLKTVGTPSQFSAFRPDPGRRSWRTWAPAVAFCGRKNFGRFRMFVARVTHFETHV
jgi:hypothetical protein